MARDLGYAVARLDTGAKQPGAQRMYERAGYAAVPDYNGNPVRRVLGGEAALTAFLLTLAGAALAVALELLEAMAIVLAVAAERGRRDALIGAGGRGRAARARRASSSGRSCSRASRSSRCRS